MSNFNTDDIEKNGDNTKRKLMIDNHIPANLIFEEQKKMVRHVPREHRPESENPFEREDGGGIYYEDFAPQTMIKNTNIYSTDKDMGLNRERVTTRASTGYRSSPL